MSKCNKFLLRLYFVLCDLNPWVVDLMCLELFRLMQPAAEVAALAPAAATACFCFFLYSAATTDAAFSKRNLFEVAPG